MKDGTVMGVHAPPPRPTAWAALCIAVVLSVAWLAVWGIATIFV